MNRYHPCLHWQRVDCGQSAVHISLDMQPSSHDSQAGSDSRAGSISERTELHFVNAFTSCCTDARLLGLFIVQHGESSSTMETTQITRASLSEQIPGARIQALNSALERPKNHLEEDGKWILKPSWPWVWARLWQDTHSGYGVLLDEGQPDCWAWPHGTWNLGKGG